MKKLCFILLVALTACNKNDNNIEKTEYRIFNEFNYQVTLISENNKQKFIIKALADTIIKTEYKIESFKIEPLYNPSEFKFEIFYDDLNKRYSIYNYTNDLMYFIEGDSAKIIKYTDFKGDTVLLKNVHLPKSIYIKKLYTNHFFLCAQKATSNNINITVAYHEYFYYKNKVADNNGFVTLEKSAPN